MFGVLIFVHELGHFIAGRWAGIQINEFAIGMGPKLFSKEKNGTVYSVRAVPMGGFCAFEGEDEDNPSPKAFSNAKLYKRIIVIIAGSVMNLLLGLILLGILSAQKPMLGTTMIAGFREGSVSSQYLEQGDEIKKVNGHRVRTDNDIIYEFIRDADGIVTMQIVRDNEKLDLTIPFKMENYDGISAIYLDFYVYGVEPTPMGVVKNAFNWTITIIKEVWGSLIDLITGRYHVNDLSGPVGVTTAISQAAQTGWTSFMTLVAFITVNLGVFNLLPLPAVDGGRLLFLLLELVRGKPVSAKYEGLVHAAGFMLLILLMVVVTFNDIVKLVQ
jgi:regulator of sigma E protease